MSKKLLIVIAACGALLILAGCAQRPEAEVTAATQAIASARDSGAAEYAPQALAAAEEANTRLQAELQAQDGKFFLTRSYGNAKTMTEEVKAASQRAADEAVANKQKAREEATALIAEARTLIDEVRVLLANAPKGKGTEVDMAAYEGDILGLETSLTNADAALTEGRYLEAKAGAEALKLGATGIKDQLNQAIQMSGQRRGRI